MNEDIEELVKRIEKLEKANEELRREIERVCDHYREDLSLRKRFDH